MTLESSEKPLQMGIEYLDDAVIAYISEILVLQQRYHSLASLSMVSKRFHLVCHSVLRESMPILLVRSEGVVTVRMWGNEVSLPYFPSWLSREGLYIPLNYPPFVCYRERIQYYPLVLYHVEAPDREEWKRYGLLPSRFKSYSLEWTLKGMTICKEEAFSKSSPLPTFKYGYVCTPEELLEEQTEPKLTSALNMIRWLSPQTYNDALSGRVQDLYVRRIYYNGRGSVISELPPPEELPLSDSVPAPSVSDPEYW